MENFPCFILQQSEEISRKPSLFAPGYRRVTVNVHRLFAPPRSALEGYRVIYFYFPLNIGRQSSVG